MSMTPAEDEAFTAFLRDKAAEADRAIKYKPNNFIKMLGSLGGYQTAVSLLTKVEPSEGFSRLWMEGRLDLSVEAIILESQWARFFDRQLLSSAESRLKHVGYKAVNLDPSVGTSSSSEAVAEAEARGASADIAPMPGSEQASSDLLFCVGRKYTRADVFTILGIFPHPTGGKWFTGHFEHGSDNFIFCNVGGAGRTGHNYDNNFVGDQLVWYARKGSKLDHPSISSLIAGKGRVFIFYRHADRDPFIFAGVAWVSDYSGAPLVRVVWSFTSHGLRYDDGKSNSEGLVEGAVSSKLVKVYERNRGARLACISRWGWQCFVCDFDFQAIYGELGKEFIHVHHLKPISEMGGEYRLDPEKDLRPVCPNCHAMLHRTVPALTIEDLKSKMLGNG